MNPPAAAPAAGRALPDRSRKLAALGGAAAAALGLLALLGWTLGMPHLASIRSFYIPMAPLTAIGFVCLGGGLLVGSTGRARGAAGLLSAALSVLVSAYALIELAEGAGIPLLALEERLVPDPPMLGGAPTARMSPWTAALLLLSGVGSLMRHLRGREGRRRKPLGDVAGVAGLLVATAAAAVLLSYLGETPFLYGTSTVPVAITTASAFLFLGAGQMVAAGPDSFPSRPFTGPSVRARLLRAFALTTGGIVVAVNLFLAYFHGIPAGRSVVSFGILAAALALVAGALVARVAVQVGADLDRAAEARDRAGEALRRSEARYRRLHETMTDAYVLVDMAGRILECNAAYCGMLGYTEAELSELTFQDLTPEAWHAFEARVVAEQILPLGFSGVYEKEYRRKDGTVFPVELRTSLLRDDAGQPAGMWAIVRDVTERRRLAAEIEAQRNTLASLVASIPDEIWFADPRGRFTLTNRSAAREFAVDAAAGTDIDVAELSRSLEVLRPDGSLRPVEEAPPLRALAGEIVRDQEELVRTPATGELRHRQVNAAPVRDAVGNIVGSVSVVRDITERKRAEAALHESEERLRLATEMGGVAVWEYDFLTNTMARSANHDGLYGLPRQEAWNMDTFLNAAHPADRDLSLRMIQSSVAPGGPDDYRFAFRVIPPDGGTRWLDVIGRVVGRNERGEGTLVRGCLIDITEIKRAEEALRAANARLRSLSRRLLDIQEEERRSLGRELHDELGQVLTAIKINVQSARRAAGSEGFVPHLAECEGLVDRALQSTRSLSLDLRPPLLDDLGLLPSLRWLADQQARRSELRVTVEAEALEGRLDPALETACFRIAQEALNNVVRHARAHAVTIHVSREDPWLRVRVRDDGAGFDPDAALRRGRGGASMGLVGMEERAALAGGGIEWHSAPGQGTEVHFWLAMTPRSPGDPT